MSYANYTMYVTLEGQYRAQQVFREAEFDALKFSRSLLSLAGNIAQLINYTNMLDYATFNVQLAQERYNEAVSESGASSREASMARHRLTAATNQLRRAEFGFFLGVADTTVSLLSQVRAIDWLAAATKVATVIDSIHAGVLWAKAHAVSILTFGFAALAGTMAIVAANTARASSSMEDAERKAQSLHQTIGEAPSWGLVKSFEDLAAVTEEVRSDVHIGGATFVISGERDLDHALNEYVRKVKADYRSSGGK